MKNRLINQYPSVLAIALLTHAGMMKATAATVTWDSDNNFANGITEAGGTFSWVPGSTAWFNNGTSNVFTVNDLSTDIARFGNGGNLSSVATINVTSGSINGLIFGATTTNGYTRAASTSGQNLSIGTGGVVVDSGAQSTTLGSTNLAITLGGAQSWTNNSTSTFTVAGSMVLSNALTINGSGTTTFSGGSASSDVSRIFTGSGGITKAGTGTMNISGNVSSAQGRWTIGNTYGGDFSMQSGALNITGIEYITLADGSVTNANYTQTGGDVTFTPIINDAGRGLYINNSTSGSSGTATFEISGGTFNMTGSNNRVYVGRGANGTAGVLTIGGGASSAIFSASSVQLTAASGRTGTVNLNSNGILETSSITDGGGTSNLIFNGGTVRVRSGTTANSTIINGLDTATLNAGGGIIDTNGINVAAAQLFSGTGRFTKSGSGVLTLSGNNTYSGGTTMNGGVLAVSIIADTGNSNIGNSGSLILGGGALRFTGTTGATNRAITFNSGTNTIEVNSGGTLTLGPSAAGQRATWSGGGGVIKSGAGTLVLGNNGDASAGDRFVIGSNYGGNFTMQQGTLTISPTSFMTIGDATQSSATATFTQTGGTTSYTATGGLYVGNWGGGSNNVAELNVSGGDFTYTAGTTFVGRGNTSATNTTGRLIVGGGASAATFTGNTFTIASANNTGIVSIQSNGTLIASSIGAGTGTSSLVMDGGTLRVRSGTAANTSLVSGLGSATLNAGGGTIDTNGINVVVSQSFGGTGALTKTGTGILTLSGANSFSGGFQINQGVVAFSNDNNLGNTGGAMTLNGGTLKSTASVTTGATRTITLGSNGGTLSNGSFQSLTMASRLTGTGTLSINYDSSANQFVSLTHGSNDYSGDTRIGTNNAGFFQDNAAAAHLRMGTTNALAFGAGRGNVIVGFQANGAAQAILDLNGFATSINGLSTNNAANASVNNSSATAATLTLGHGDASASFGGVIRNTGGALSLVKTGTGTQTLSGVNTYTGATQINEGTLALSGSGSISSSSSLTLAANTTLDITGVINSFQLGSSQSLSGNGRILATGKTVVAAGTLTPGASPGTLVQDGGVLQLAASGQFNWEIANAAGTAGSGYDTVSLINGATLDLSLLSANNPYQINLWSLSGTGPFSNGLASNFDNTQSYEWTLFSTTQAINNFSSDLFAVNIGATNGTGGFANDLNGGTFSVILGDNNTDLMLRFNAIPETSVSLLGVLGALTFLRRRR